MHIQNPSKMSITPHIKKGSVSMSASASLRVFVSVDIVVGLDAVCGGFHWKVAGWMFQPWTVTLMLAGSGLGDSMVTTRGSPGRSEK